MTYEPGVINAKSLEELRQGISQELRRISDVLQDIDASGGQLYIGGEISSVEAVQFKTGVEPIETAAKLWYDDTHETFSFKTNVGNTIQIGEEIGDIGVNDTGGDAEGKVVYANGTQGHRFTFDLADAREASKCGLVGVCTTSNGDSQEDFVTTFGIVHGLDTSSWAAGTRLYIAADATGTLTSTAPSAPNFVVWVATVLDQHATQGTIFVSPRFDFGNGITFTNLSIINSLTFSGAGRIDWAKITADSITASGGSIAGFTVSDLQVDNDGNILDYTETAGATNDLIVDFVNVSAINWIKILASYEGAANHIIEVQLYNWSTAAWDNFTCMGNVYTATGTVLCDHSFFLPHGADYIGTGANEGDVRVRFLHNGTAVTNHHWYFDEVALYQ